MIDTELGSAPLQKFLPDLSLPAETLLDLSGDQSKLGWSWFFKSGLEKRIIAAWQQPLNELTCGQCRMLVGQRFGLKWLAAPVSTFVALYPQAECDLYPGDLSINALIAWREIFGHAPDEARQMLSADFSWINEEITDFTESDLFMRAKAGLRDARKASFS
jgi:hypothetical protein